MDDADETLGRGEPGEYVHYLRARSMLEKRLGATPQEIGMWTSFGKELHGKPAGGINGYLDPDLYAGRPRRFRFKDPIAEDFDYLSQLMACYYRLDDLEHFQPQDRYLTYEAVVRRFRRFCSQEEAIALLRTKVMDGELDSFHPITGGTAGTRSWGDESGFPPLSDGIFWLKQVIGVETDCAPDIAQVPDVRNGITPKEFISKHAAFVDGGKKYLDKWFKGESREKGEQPAAAKYRIAGVHGRYDEDALIAALKAARRYKFR